MTSKKHPPVWSLQHQAMATVFTIHFPCDLISEQDARALAHVLFQEVDHLENELSRYVSHSEISKIARLNAGETLKISSAAFDCLNLAQAVAKETDGAFDITIAPLMRLWRTKDGKTRKPSPEELAFVEKRIGWNQYKLNRNEQSIEVLVSCLELDLGAVGKGYTLDILAHMLENENVSHFLLDAGTSSILAQGNGPDLSGMPEDEPHAAQAPHTAPSGWRIRTLDGIMPTVTLQNEAISGSGQEVKGNHLMNPRTLSPLPMNPQIHRVIAPTAALSDALSTAFSVMDLAEQERFLVKIPKVRLA